MQKLLSYLTLFAFIGNNSIAQDSTIITKDSSINVHPITSSNSVISAKAITEKRPVYKLKLAADIPITLIGASWSGYAFTKIYSKDPLTIQELESLNPDKINSFDRPAIKHYSESSSQFADYIFYGSMPLPILLLADKKMRKDLPTLTYLYLEAMSVTGLFYTSSVYFADRYRPYTYNKAVPLDFRLRGGSRNSFFAGHPALVGTSTFFMATVYADYHPDSKIKWVFYTIASGATAGISVLRYLGGRHFLSDLLIGTTLGPLSGILTPRLHKNKTGRLPSTTFLPYFGKGPGIALLHTF
jgi:membrane-associated phospholipid phosphatase